MTVTTGFQKNPSTGSLLGMKSNPLSTVKVDYAVTNRGDHFETALRIITLLIHLGFLVGLYIQVWHASMRLFQKPPDPCAPNPCRHDGLCLEGHNGYYCVCKEGWTGKNCTLNIGKF
ncbi:uncharacterized protein [Branchiostoma lanceolatum]|uniref:uncharacterized protein n=1 Tax=Branchiostoma lanceolatum TaxID=7740 RepID=UPI0034541963